MFFVFENVELNVALRYHDAESKQAVVSVHLELRSRSWRDVHILCITDRAQDGVGCHLGRENRGRREECLKIIFETPQHLIPRQKNLFQQAE